MRSSNSRSLSKREKSPPVRSARAWLAFLCMALPVHSIGLREPSLRKISDLPGRNEMAYTEAFVEATSWTRDPLSEPTLPWSCSPAISTITFWLLGGALRRVRIARFMASNSAEAEFPELIEDRALEMASWSDVN